MKDRLLKFLIHLIGLKNAYRFGRALYVRARKECPNNISINGELFVQEQFIKQFCLSERVVIFDVGANIGEWTSAFINRICQIGSSQKIQFHLFEPVKQTFSVLQERLRGYPSTNNIILNNMALSDVAGFDSMFIIEGSSGINSFHSPTLEEPTTVQQIEKSTLDDYCKTNNISEIHFIKVDTEGHDYCVIKGGLELFLNEKILVCQFEYNLRWIYGRHFLKDVFDLFIETPYKIGKITPYTVEFYNSWHPELERFFEGNYLIVHKKAIHCFEHHTGDFDQFWLYQKE